MKNYTFPFVISALFSEGISRRRCELHCSGPPSSSPSPLPTHTSLYLHPLTHSLSHTFPSCLSAASVSVSSLRWTLTHSLTPGRLDYNRDHWIISLADRYTSSLSHRGDTHTIPGSTWGVVCHAFPSTTSGSPARVSYGGTGKNREKLP